MEYAHTVLALAALVLGGIQMARRKSGGAHRRLGQAYVGAMALTALSSFFLTGLTGGMNGLHVLSVWTLITLAISIRARRRGNIMGHGYSMIMLYGGLLTAGLFAAQRHGLDLPVWLVVGMLVAMWAGLLVMAERMRRRFSRRGETADAAAA
ncbi:MAG: DUF2306 domain-containing protein [Minwuia sp.]|uniref:DUF2306 domain-containing protein n=1 Tax=Minwuia sp. TaxID=2493630 RepID=UPI003A8C580C